MSTILTRELLTEGQSHTEIMLVTVVSASILEKVSLRTRSEA